MRAATGPSPTIGASPQTGNGRFPPSRVTGRSLVTHDPETRERITCAGGRKLTLGELRRLCGFPDDFTLTGTYEQRYERLGRAVPPVMMSAIATAVRDRILAPAPERAASA